MKSITLLILTGILLFTAPNYIMAKDFEWMKELNAQATLDPKGFRARLAARFQVEDAKIGAVLNKTGEPASTYMVFRLAEMSKKPVEKVIGVYEKNRGRGWGVIAKQLGIKPGSKEFKALKESHDLYSKEKGGKKGSSRGKPNSKVL